MGRPKGSKNKVQKVATKHPSKLAVHFSSKRGDHGTPQWLFDRLNERFKFKMDLAASGKNKLCDKYFSEKDNGLELTWPKGWSWCNPPYGKSLIYWAKKAYEQSEEGRDCIMLLPARTDTKWFHQYILPFASAVIFIRGRLTFKGEPASAPFPSMLVVWKKREAGVDISIKTISKAKEIKDGKPGKSKRPIQGKLQNFRGKRNLHDNASSQPSA